MFCTSCGARLDPGVRFCGVCGQAAEVLEANISQPAYAAGSIISPPSAPLPAVREYPAARGGKERTDVGGIALTAALGLPLFAALCAVMSIFSVRATVGGGLVASMADIPAGDVAVVAGGFGRSALFSIHALRAAASFAALTLFNIAALNSARIRRAFLCVGAALAAAGLAFTVCGLRLESLRDIAALSPLMELPVFSEFYEDAGIHILRVGLAALAAALLAVAAYFASRAARPGASVKRAEKSTVRLIVTSAVSAAATAACGWFAYMAFAA